MQFELLYQELAQGVEIIRALTAGVGQAEAQVKPAPESWSILEVVCHLYDEEREDFREHLDLILHRPDDKWSPIDPEGWVSRRNYNERDLGQVVAGFVAEREQSLAWLRGLAGANWDAAYHTAYGPITAGDMFAAWVAHDNLHMRQLVELRRGRVVTLAEPYDVRYAGEW
jgi:hypothetical protein